MLEKINVDFSYEDSRGFLVQLVHQGYQQVNVLKSNRGTVRGGHYHRDTTEAFYVIFGSVEVDCYKSGEERITHTFVEGDFFTVKPYEIHSMKFPEDCLMVQLYSKPVERDNGTKDIYSEGGLDG